MWMPNKVGGLGVMPSYQGGDVKDPAGTTHAGIVGIKVIMVFPGNESQHDAMRITVANGS
jgi:hypothetical protein